MCDGGTSWDALGSQALSPEEAATECAAKEAVEKEDYTEFGTIEPDSEAAARASHGRGVTIEFLVRWTDEHDLHDWPTWRVVRDIVKPMTAKTRCRYAELPEMEGVVGPAQSFGSRASVGCSNRRAPCGRPRANSRRTSPGGPDSRRRRRLYLDLVFRSAPAHQYHNHASSKNVVHDQDRRRSLPLKDAPHLVRRAPSLMHPNRARPARGPRNLI